MKNLNGKRKKWENLNQNTLKQTYEPPKATFVPIKIEERLLACTCKAGVKACYSGGTLSVFAS
jgi:hypothetical protein